jgi:hypothetical protein
VLLLDLQADSVNRSASSEIVNEPF